MCVCWGGGGEGGRCKYSAQLSPFHMEKPSKSNYVSFVMVMVFYITLIVISAIYLHINTESQL